jgi:hypothetical protein
MTEKYSHATYSYYIISEFSPKFHACEHKHADFRNYKYESMYMCLSGDASRLIDD